MDDQLRTALTRLSAVTDDWLGLSDILRTDGRIILESLLTDSENQTLRRSFVRACWAYVEAITFSVKKFMLTACQFGSDRFTVEEQVFLASQRLVVDPEGEVAVYREPVNALENVKRTFRLAARVLDTEWTPDFGVEGWQRLRKAIQIRHRLTHPKTVAEVNVSDDDFDDLKQGISWFIQMITAFDTAVLARYGQNEP